MPPSDPITIIGAGLAGSQAALTIANQGGEVLLLEMRPLVRTPAHQTSLPAELVCSNSLRSREAGTAPGLLKAELSQLNCDLLTIAEEVAVPGGSSLSVDRREFSKRVNQTLEAHPRIHLRREEVTALPPDQTCIVATGPLTSDALTRSLQGLTGEENLFFHDAINPVIEADSVSMEKVFAASRYGKGGDDFLNCPMDRQAYLAFREAILAAEGYATHEFEDWKLFGCPPLEELARRGEDTLRYGPLKPVGLVDPRTGRQPYAVLQLRQENLRCDSYNMVGGQNQLKFGEQKRVFRLVPGLEEVEFVRFGQMHRNTYANAPRLLTRNLNLREHPHLFLAGQLAGVEGYVESMATGLLAGLNALRQLQGLPLLDLPRSTAIGSICHYLACAQPKEFVPVRFTFDLLPPLEVERAARRLNRKQRRAQRRAQHFNRALNTIEVFLDKHRPVAVVG